MAQRQQSGGSGVLSFLLKGDQAAAWRFIDGTELLSITANLGDAKSTITHPATTTHKNLSEADRESLGISDGMVRLSVGLEDVQDLIADIEHGLTLV